MGYFDGISLHNDVKILGKKYADRYQDIETRSQAAKDSPEKSFEIMRERARLVAEWTVGTEFAMALSRTLYCVNVPVNRAVMGIAIDHLNSLNLALVNSTGTCWRGSKNPDDSYHWSFLYNNCASTAHNTLASIGVVPEIPTDLPFFKQLGHEAIPGASLLKIFKSMVLKQPTIKSLYQSPEIHEMVTQYSWAPISKGA